MVQMGIIVGCFILFDIITGILKALYQEGINSTKLRQGLFHKLSEVLAVAGSMLLEIGADYMNFGLNLPLTKTVVTYICIMEFVSILENLCEINPELEKLFKPYLQKLKEKEIEESEGV